MTGFDVKRAVITALIDHHEITLRDQFAMAALQMISPTEYSRDLTSQEIAQRAYALADAMMEARKPQKQLPKKGVYR